MIVIMQLQCSLEMYHHLRSVVYGELPPIEPIVQVNYLRNKSVAPNYISSVSQSLLAREDSRNLMPSVPTVDEQREWLRRMWHFVT